MEAERRPLGFTSHSWSRAQTYTARDFGKAATHGLSGFWTIHPSLSLVPIISLMSKGRFLLRVGEDVAMYTGWGKCKAKGTMLDIRRSGPYEMFTLIELNGSRMWVAGKAAKGLPMFFD
ncbi:MAG: hypothetical protein AB7W59_11460 [Acidimicrobiia bacterium]